MRIIDDLRMASEGPVTVWGWARITALFAVEALTVLALLAKAWELQSLLWEAIEHISGLFAW